MKADTAEVLQPAEQKHEPPLISLRGVSKRFRNGECETEVLHGIDLDIYPGEFVALIGTATAVGNVEVHALLLARHDGVEDFQSRNMASIIDSVSATQNTMTLLVGGIGVMNIMLVSVTERTREVGIRMATGARNILQQFLTEALTVSALGGLIGVAVGLGVTALIAFFGTPVQYAAAPVVLAFGCAITEPASRPDMDLPGQWQEPIPTNGATADDTAWWRHFESVRYWVGDGGVRGRRRLSVTAGIVM